MNQKTSLFWSFKLNFMSDESKLAPERALHLRLAAVPTDEAERALENRFDTYFKSLAPASKSIYLKSWTTFAAHHGVWGQQNKRVPKVTDPDSKLLLCASISAQIDNAVKLSGITLILSAWADGQWPNRPRHNPV